MKKMIVKILLACVLLYLFFRWFERSNIWMPTRTFYGTPEVINLSFEDVYFQTEDGVQLNGWYVPSTNPKAALLFCHGNGGNISYRTESLRQFHTLNLSVFLFDYRGYGKSRGWLTEEGTYRDARAAYQWLKKKEPNLPLVLFGRSLGANIAADLATKVEAAALIYESGFNSVQILGSELFPFLPVRWMTKYSYNGLEKIKRVKMPILVIHSPDDEIVPIHHGKKLYDTAPEPKRFLEITGGHNDGFIVSEETYIPGINAFIDETIVNEKNPIRLTNSLESGSMDENR